MQDVINGPFSNEVQNTLGPHGLPILDTLAYGCVSNCLVNTTIYPFPRILSSSGEITWWSPSLTSVDPAGPRT